jgi:hypothetical protein
LCIPATSGYTGITGILFKECRHIHRYAGLTYMLYRAGAGEAGLTDLRRSLVRHVDPGYGQRSYPGYLSQLRCPIPTIKERYSSAWRKLVLAGCTVLVYLPSLCTSTSLPQSGKVTVLEVQGTARASPIESNQGESHGSLPSSASPIWSVAGVSWSLMTVVTLVTTI